MRRVGHQEDRLDGRVELLVHPDHGEFVLEVGDRSKSPDDDLRPYALGELHQQCVKRLDDDLGAVFDLGALLLDHGHPLSRG